MAPARAAAVAGELLRISSLRFAPIGGDELDGVAALELMTQRQGQVPLLKQCTLNPDECSRAKLSINLGACAALRWRRRLPAWGP